MTEDLVTRISAAIVGGEFQPGDRLRQEALAARFGVSRQPVREALRHVQAQGLVEIHHRQGVLVRRPSVRDVRDAYLVRAELEGLAIELAVRRAGTGELCKIRATEEEYWRLGHKPAVASQEASAAEERARANLAFHTAVLEAAGSRLLLETTARLLLVVPSGVSSAAMTKPRTIEGIAEEHRSIRKAIEAGDTEAARVAMVRHIWHSGELVPEHYEGETATDRMKSDRAFLRSRRS